MAAPMLHALFERLGLALAVLALTACAEQPTALYLVIDTELEVPTEVDTLAIRVEPENRDVVEREIDLAMSTRPGRMRVDPPEGNLDAAVRFVIAVRRGDDEVVTRTIATRFLPGSVRVVPVFLERACVEISCGDEHTCRAGNCISPEIDPATLIEWTPGVEPGADSDAGPPDAGPDAGDGGPPDTGPPDAWVDPELRAVSTTATLLEALAWAEARAGEQTIELAAGTYELADEIVLDQSVTIRGPSRCGAVLQSSGTSRVLQVSDGEVTLDGLAITGGRESADQGGGLLVHGSGVVTLEHSCVLGNAVLENAQGGGVAVVRGGRLTLRDSDIVENGAGQRGGGLYVSGGSAQLVDCDISRNRITTMLADTAGAGIASIDAALSLDRCLVSGNDTDRAVTTAAHAGGLYAYGGSVRVTNSTFSGNRGYYGVAMLLDALSAELEHVTVADNTSVSEGGRAIWSPGNTGFTLANSVFSNNRASNGAVLHCHASITSLGGNVADELEEAAGYDCGMQLTRPGTDRVGNPRLLPLADNGGPTATHGLGLGSAAVAHAREENCPEVDQRGVARTPPCDSGAFETPPE